MFPQLSLHERCVSHEAEPELNQLLNISMRIVRENTCRKKHKMPVSVCLCVCVCVRVHACVWPCDINMEFDQNEGFGCSAKPNNGKMPVSIVS